jgi:putrescine transport system permease protein
LTSRNGFRGAALSLGLAFLYLPILSMIVFSFNYSKLVTVWDSARSPTLKWYRLLLETNRSSTPPGFHPIAATTATGAVVLRTLAVGACALRTVRGRFPRGHDGRAAGHAGGHYRPVVLLLFVALERFTGWPEGRGVLTSRSRTSFAWPM